VIAAVKACFPDNVESSVKISTAMDQTGQTVRNEIMDFDLRRDTIEHVANILANHNDTSHRQAVRHNTLVIIYVRLEKVHQTRPLKEA